MCIFVAGRCNVHARAHLHLSFLFAPGYSTMSVGIADVFLLPRTPEGPSRAERPSTMSSVELITYLGWMTGTVRQMVNRLSRAAESVQYLQRSIRTSGRSSWNIGKHVREHLLAIQSKSMVLLYLFPCLPAWRNYNDGFIACDCFLNVPPSDTRTLAYQVFSYKEANFPCLSCMIL